MTELSDELLVAYVDGQLAHKQSSAIERVLAHDDVIARRVAALKKAHRRLEAAFDAVLAGEEEAAVSHPVPPSPGLLIPWPTLIKAGLAAAGIVLGWMWMEDAQGRLLWVFGTIMLLGAGALVLGVVFPNQRFTPPMRRAVEIFEAACIASVLPLALAVMGLYSTLRHLDIG